MKESFRQLLRKYFHFLGKDRNAVISLIGGIVLILAGHLVVDNFELKPHNDFSKFEKALKEWENETDLPVGHSNLFEFDPNTVSEGTLDSLNIPSFIKKNLLSYRSAGGRFSQKEDIRKIYGMNDSIFAAIEPFIFIVPRPIEPERGKLEYYSSGEKGIFDPNTANATDLYRFGFNRFQASNLLKYRKSGGRFSRAEDLLVVYGIDSVFLETIEKSVQITELPAVEVINDSPLSVKEPKLSPLVELNGADSLDLVSLSGIGPVFASRIIKYRELLGGFFTPRQLLEVYGFPEETFFAINENIIVDTLKVEKIRLNFAGYSELIRHPYFTKKQVDAIIDYRQKKGPFSSNEHLVQAGLVDSVAFHILEPYITCR